MTRQMGIEAVPGHQFQFTRNWFLNRNGETFREYVHPEWAGKPITYLELGVFEGMSMTWMLQHVLTHPDAKAVGVDPWLITTKLSAETMDQVMRRAHQNIEPWTGVFGNKCQLIRGNSAEVLRLMLKNKFGYHGIKRGSVDLCMVDGDHNELGVLDDCRLVWQLLKPGGCMLCDDVENDKQKEHHVKQGLEMFLAETPGAELAWKHKYVECYRKVVA